MYTNCSGNELDLEKEYWPSRHTTRFQDYPNPSEQVIANFVRVLQEETDRVRQNYKVRSDVRYGGVDDNQLLDIYYRDEEKDTPIFVYIHGGYWQFLDKNTSGSFVAPLIEQGYRVVAMDYNLCPQVTLEQQTEQIWHFYDWLFQYAQETNAKSISLAGHSAGAHLAALLLSPKMLTIPGADLVANFYLISGVYDLRELWPLESTNPGNILSLNADNAEQLSPMLTSLSAELLQFVNRRQIRFHVLVAEHDSESFIEQSRKYSEKLEAVGVNVTFRIFEKYDHFDIIEEVPLAGAEINCYILDSLK